MSINYKQAFGQAIIAASLALTPVTATTAFAAENASPTKVSLAKKPNVIMQAYNASAELGTAGILIVRAPTSPDGKPEYSWGQIVAITKGLLAENNITDYKLIAAQASRGETTFRIFIDKESLQYSWGDVEAGIEDIPKRVETARLAARHDDQIVAAR